MSHGGSAIVLPPRVCFFGTYARGYTVSQILRRAIERAGATVIDCHEPLWERSITKPDSYFSFPSLARHAFTYLGAARRLAARHARLDSVDLYVVGFQGQLDLLLLTRLLRQERRPILFAPLVTLSETLVEDRRLFGPATPQAAVLGALDRRTLRAATRVLIDTRAHADYLRDSLDVNAEKISTWYLGCDEEVFRPAAAPDPRDQVRVLFYGSFLPLHGVEIILEAAKRLRDERQITVDLHGAGPALAACREAALRLEIPNLRFLPWCPYESLGELIAGYDLCLGVFGGSRKSRMVIPNKIYQCAAVGRTVITADTPAVREIFAHGETIWMCKNDGGASLAEAILELARDRQQRERIARQAQQLMKERFSALEQARRVGLILAQACSV